MLPKTGNERFRAKTSTYGDLGLQVRGFRRTNDFYYGSSMLYHDFVSRLPQAIRLISRAPWFSVVQLFVTIDLARVAMVNASLGIAMFRGVFHVLQSSYSRICYRRRVTTNFSKPIRGLVRSGLIYLSSAPNRLQSKQALDFQPSAVLPARSKCGVSTQVAGSQCLGLPCRLRDVLPGSLLVEGETTFLVGPLVGHASRVFCGKAVSPFIYFSNRRVFIRSSLHFFRYGGPPMGCCFLLLPRLTLFPVPPCANSCTSIHSCALDKGRPFLYFVLPSYSVRADSCLPGRLAFFPMEFVMGAVLPSKHPSIALLCASERGILCGTAIKLSSLHGREDTTFS